MKGLRKKSATRGRILVFCLTAATLLGGMAYVSSVNVAANHPVLVEGNCDSPVPGTTIVNIGQCGDYDGDGRIGSAEDTDGADRIFGTLAAPNGAMGPGVGAAAGTGANWNGTITIVRSGRFAESIFIGNSGFIPGLGTPTPGNVTLQAAPGVDADIDAVLQGDPAGGNTSRQAGIGIYILYSASNTGTVVTLRNLNIRNWAEGITIGLNSRVNIEGCRIENNRDHGVHVTDFSMVTVNNSSFTANGRRIPVSGPSSPGNGLSVSGGPNPQARISNSTFQHNFAAGIQNSYGPANVSLYNVGTYFNGTDIVGAVTIAPNPNYAN